MSRSYLWSLPIALAWPVVKTLIFFYRFEELPFQILKSSLIFLPVGLISAVALIYMLERAGSINRKVSTVFGYLLASPFALIASMFSGFLLPSLISPLFYGALPLVLGAAVGYIIGGLMNNSSQNAI